jgi:hypothetical protein
MATKSADLIAARELALFIENDQTLYFRQAQPIIKNLARKLQKGVFDKAKSIKLWGYLAESGAKKYAASFGGKWFEMFDVSTRKKTAEQLADSYDEEIRMQLKGDYFISIMDGRERAFYNKADNVWTIYPDNATRYKTLADVKKAAAKVRLLTNKAVELYRAFNDGTNWNFSQV